MRHMLILLILCLVLSVTGNTRRNGDEIFAFFSDSLLHSIQDKNIKHMAVLPFSGGDSIAEEWGIAIAEYLIVKMNNRKNFKLIDRTEFKKMLQEIHLSETGMVDEATVLRVGKFLSADAICTGTIRNLFGVKQITAKILRTETGEVLGSAVISIPANELTIFAKDRFSEKATITATLFRSLLIPGWGQFYLNRPIRGAVSLSLGATSLGFLLFSSVQSGSARSDLDKHRESANGAAWTGRWDEYTLTLHNLENDHTAAYDRAILAGCITGGVWVLNCIDAAIAGKQVKTNIVPYFSHDFSGKISIGFTMSL